MSFEDSDDNERYLAILTTDGIVPARELEGNKIIIYEAVMIDNDTKEEKEILIFLPLSYFGKCFSHLFYPGDAVSVKAMKKDEAPSVVLALSVYPMTEDEMPSEIKALQDKVRIKLWQN